MDKRGKVVLKENQANAKLGSISFYEEVQWVSCSRITRAPYRMKVKIFVRLVDRSNLFASD